MAYSKKVWKDRVSEQPQRRLITPVGGGSATTVDVVRQEGIVIQEGDAFSAANMNDLENRIKNCFDSNESTINVINTKANTNADNITSLQNNLNSVSGRVTANTNSIAANQNTEASHYNALSTRASSLESRAAAIEGELTANNQRIYMDYKYGKYGINTSANRGADTFIPFKNMTEIVTALPKELTCHAYGGPGAQQEGGVHGDAHMSIVSPGNGTVTLKMSAEHNNVGQPWGDGVCNGVRVILNYNETKTLNVYEGQAVSFSCWMDQLDMWEHNTAILSIQWNLS